MKKLYQPFIVGIIFILDRFSKEWIINKMFLGESWELLPFFHLTYVRNSGVAFGLGQNSNSIFTIISASLILLLVIFKKKIWHMENLWVNTGVAFIIGGAIGNFYDRIVYKSVVDFLDFFAGSYHWPAFNIADSSICLGVIILILIQLTYQNNH